MLRSMLLHFDMILAGRRDSLMGPLSLSADPGTWLVSSSKKPGKLLAQQKNLPVFTLCRCIWCWWAGRAVSFYFW